MVNWPAIIFGVLALISASFGVIWHIKYRTVEKSLDIEFDRVNKINEHNVELEQQLSQSTAIIDQCQKRIENIKPVEKYISVQPFDVFSEEYLYKMHEIAESKEFRFFMYLFRQDMGALVKKNQALIPYYWHYCNCFDLFEEELGRTNNEYHISEKKQDATE